LPSIFQVNGLVNNLLGSKNEATDVLPSKQRGQLPSRCQRGSRKPSRLPDAALIYMAVCTGHSFKSPPKEKARARPASTMVPSQAPSSSDGMQSSKYQFIKNLGKG
jgi:hypothetical protein